MGLLFGMSDIGAATFVLLLLTFGVLPGWIAARRKAQHYLPIAILSLVACADYSSHGALVWAIALIWSCYDKPKDPPIRPVSQD